MSEAQKNQGKDLHLATGLGCYPSLDDSLDIFEEVNHHQQLFAVASYRSQEQKLGNINSPEIFKTIKDFINQLCSQKNIITDKINDSQFDKQLQQTKILASLNNELAFYRQSLLSNQKKYKQSEENWQKITKDNQNKHRKQIKKYIELINQKQNQIENLKKSIKSQTNRILNLTNEIQSLNQLKLSLENTVQKSIQSIKSNIKQLNFSLEQNELDKVVLQGKYKQLCDKIEQIIKQCQQLQNQKNKIEKKYEIMKQNYQNKKNQNIELRFEIERYKIKIKDLSNDKIHNINNHIPANPSHEETATTLSELKQNSMDLLQKITNINQSRSKLQAIQNINDKLKQFINQNNNLKLQLQEKQIQIDQLQLMIQGNGYEDTIVRNRSYSLFQLLTAKKNQIQIFQNKIGQIQNRATKAEQLLIKTNNDYLTTIELCHQQSTLLNGPQSENKTKPKQTTPQFLQVFELQKSKIIEKEKEHYQKLREKDRKSVKQLEDKCQILKKQNERLLKQNDQFSKQKKKYPNLNQNQFTEINQQNNPRKKKGGGGGGGGKTKIKPKCIVCGLELGGIKITKCTDCLSKIHIDCQKNHHCDFRIIENSDFQVSSSLN